MFFHSIYLAIMCIFIFIVKTVNFSFMVFSIVFLNGDFSFRSYCYKKKDKKIEKSMKKDICRRRKKDGHIGF